MDVKDFLKTHDISYDVLPHRETFGAQRMAQVLHVSGREVSKTVLMRADRGYAYIVAVLPANKEIDWRLASEALGGSQLELATEHEIAEHCPDCEFGALPPFGTQYGMHTLMDKSLLDHEEIVFEGNNHHEAIRIRTRDFRQIEEPMLADFARE